ncbi:uncharacterized protein Fot_37166 [Forsythia ovata]|uniref:Tac7077 n=1 Tax=Forsythia ovata TaxID=205694 RepID=A0ABD1SUE0_9LAMI
MAAASNFLVGQRDFKMLSFRRVFSNVSTASVVDISNGPRRFRLKGCCSEYYSNSIRNNDYNGVQNVKAYAPCLQPLLRDLEEVVTVEDPQNGPNSRAFSGVLGAAASTNRGSSTGFRDQHFPEKIMVAVDVDEVLGNFISALNQFIADRYSLNHSISEYHVYEFFKIWNCSRDEADIRVHEFFETSYFKKGIHPIPGALKALQNLSELCNLSVVTSRQNAIKQDTIAWIEKHYPGVFQEIQFGNHFALDGHARPKSEICKSLGAKVLIDDNPRYAIECADAGIRVLLFDYENSYPWCKTESVNQHPLVTRVNNWEEICLEKTHTREDYKRKERLKECAPDKSICLEKTHKREDYKGKERLKECAPDKPNMTLLPAVQNEHSGGERPVEKFGIVLFPVAVSITRPSGPD